MALPLRPFGSTGLMVSPIGLGTVKLGRREGVKYPATFELPTDEQAIDLLSVARDLGVNLIDTAPAYGRSEERLGVLLHRVAPREHWVLCTKAGEHFEHGVSTFDFSPEGVVASVERSLRRLRTEYLDIVLLHSDGRDEQIILQTGALDALRDLKRRGLVRAIGVSTKTPEGAVLAVDHGDAVMLTLNAASRADAPAAARAGERGVGVLVKKALASGHEADPAAALRAVLSMAGVGCVVVGTLNPKHLEANIMAVTGSGEPPPGARCTGGTPRDTERDHSS